MSKPASVIYIFKQAFGGADAFAPLAAELALNHHEDVVLDFVFITEAAKREVSSSAFHVDLFSRYGSLRDLTTGGGGRLLAPFMKFVRLLALVLYRKFTCRSLCIVYSVTGRGPKERVLGWLLARLGRHYSFPGIQVPWTRIMSERFNLEKHAAVNVLDGRKLKAARYRAHKAICYLGSEIPLIQAHREENAQLYPIGLPRLYGGWRQCLESLGQKYLKLEKQRMGWSEDARFAVIILTTPDFIWFDNRETYFVMLDQAIECLRREFPGIHIVLKAKAKFQATFGDIEQRYGSPDIRVSSCGLAVFAAEAVVALTVNETSGVFDFIVAGVPVVEYGSYNAKWQSIHHAKSAWIDLPGLHYVETEQELTNTLRAISGGTITGVSQAHLSAHFGHHMDLAPFLSPA